MTNVFVSTKCWFMQPGDFAEIPIEDVPLIGIVYEAAEHHYDADILIDGHHFYGAKGETEGDRSYVLSGYMPSADGYGRVHWVLVPKGRHTIRVEVANVYNRMLDIVGINPFEFCLSGFILMKDIVFPPPAYGSWCFKKMVGQDFLTSERPNLLQEMGWTTYRSPRETYINKIVPSRGYLYLMDLFGQGSLDFITARTDDAVRLDIFDGSIFDASWTGRKDIEVLTWSRRISLRDEDKDVYAGLTSSVNEQGAFQITSSKRINFGNRLLVRLFNPDAEERALLGVYMEGSLRLI